ncbi:hypothetical protein [Agaribacter flavus]|uniref:Uncharacterized protein n=1 Tax=Agaribacter flavus TaxID=1902781 RepID=A0ABV7FM45_9ALTE
MRRSARVFNHITYKVNANTPAEYAMDFWHQRASELCGNSHYFADAKLRVKHRYTVSQSERGGINVENTESGSSFVSPPTSQITINKSQRFPKVSGYTYCDGKPEMLFIHKTPEQQCELKRELKRRNVNVQSLAANCDSVKSHANADNLILPSKTTVSIRSHST